MRLIDSVLCLSAMVVMLADVAQSGRDGRAGEPAAQPKRELIGTVLEKPVYRDQLRTEESLASDLRELFFPPLMTKYRKEHEADITPSSAEVEAVTEFFDRKHRERIKDVEPELREKLNAIEARLELEDLPARERQDLEVKKRKLEVQLNPPGKQFAEFYLNHWKFQRHLYDKFGGGRVLWQQGGIEAFDATRVWLETQEKKGELKINDAALRTKFFEYWTTHKHGAFLTADKERIRREFLEPEWAPKPSK